MYVDRSHRYSQSRFMSRPDCFQESGAIRFIYQLNEHSYNVAAIRRFRHGLQAFAVDKIGKTADDF